MIPRHPVRRARSEWLDPHYPKGARQPGHFNRLFADSSGAARSTNTLLEPGRFENRRLEASMRIQRIFPYPWAAVAEHNADYRTFGQAEALRIGADHPSRIQSLVGTRPAPADRLLTA